MWNGSVDYDAMEEDLGWRMVRGLKKRIHGLSKHVVYYSLGTPLTNEHYLNATRANIYGIEKSPSQVGPLGFTPRAEFEGLYLCGQSTLSHGVAGVTAWGIDSAKAVLNCRSRDILTQKGSGPLFLQAEEPSAVTGVFEAEDGTRRGGEGRGGNRDIETSCNRRRII